MHSFHHKKTQSMPMPVIEDSFSSDDEGDETLLIDDPSIEPSQPPAMILYAGQSARPYEVSQSLIISYSAKFRTYLTNSQTLNSTDTVHVHLPEFSPETISAVLYYVQTNQLPLEVAPYMNPHETVQIFACAAFLGIPTLLSHVFGLFGNDIHPWNYHYNHEDEVAMGYGVKYVLSTYGTQDWNPKVLNAVLVFLCKSKMTHIIREKGIMDKLKDGGVGLEVEIISALMGQCVDMHGMLEQFIVAGRRHGS